MINSICDMNANMNIPHRFSNVCILTALLQYFPNAKSLVIHITKKVPFIYIL